MKILITIPAFNEETVIEGTVAHLYQFLNARVPFDFEVVIAENGSSDRTFDIANSLVSHYPHLRVSRGKLPGRGRVLKTEWSQSDADVLAYMDADLSTDLNAFPSLITPLISGEFDLSTGSRLLNPRNTTRCLKRELTSRCYNRLATFLLRIPTSDAQCGFKAITKRAARSLLPLIDHPNWFFDTQLLALAHGFGFRILEVPITWSERHNSHVKMIPSIFEHLFGLFHLRKKLLRLHRTSQNRSVNTLPRV